MIKSVFIVKEEPCEFSDVDIVYHKICLTKERADILANEIREDNPDECENITVIEYNLD